MLAGNGIIKRNNPTKKALLFIFVYVYTEIVFGTVVHIFGLLYVYLVI